MKKILVILTLISFVAVNISVAQAPQAAKTTKTETVSKSEAKSSTPSCCKGKSAANCSAEMKNYTPEQKAACMKACSGHSEKSEKTKADAGTEKKEATKANNQ